MAKNADDPRNIVVRDDPDSERYVVEVDGQLAGLADYRIKGERHLFVHTEVKDEFSGRGLGSRLARFALDDVRSSGRTIVPICPFIAAWIERHPDYKESVDLAMLEKVLERSRQAP